MFRFFRIASVYVFGILLFQEAFASDLPFTDVPVNHSAYSAIKNLFDNGAITDDGSHLFHPEDQIDRDAYVGLSVSVSCKKCLTPSLEDIVRYQKSPFIDLTKKNPYFYCISYAAEKKIVQGYILDNTGKSTCENGKSYSTSPFCENNKTSRIEAAAMLLRQANLWNDTLNTGFQKTVPLSDVTPYWQGYAEKGIQIGILSIQENNTLRPDESITRGEFAMMAAKMLAYNQCRSANTDTSTVSSDLVVRDQVGKIIPKTHFSSGSTDVLDVVTETAGNWGRNWTLINPLTGEKKSGNGNTYPISDLSCGTWIASVDLIDTARNTLVSTSSTTIVIECSTTPPTSLGVDIRGTPLNTYLDNPIHFDALVQGGKGNMQYTWDFGDGNTSHSSGSVDHAYTTPGTHKVTLTVTDEDGTSAQSNLIVIISGDKDQDGDGVLDSQDACPLVKGPPENKGCPRVKNEQYGEDIIDGLTHGSNTPTDALVDVAIVVKDQGGNPIDRTIFPEKSLDYLTLTGSHTDSTEKSWTLTQTTTNTIIHGTGDIFPLKDLTCGVWIAEVKLIDKNSQKVLSSATATIVIMCEKVQVENPISVKIEGDPLQASIDKPIDFFSTVQGGSGNIQYQWTYGDGTSSTDVKNSSHTYGSPGSYTVTLTVTDTQGRTAYSRMVVSISRNSSYAPTIIGSLTKNLCLAEKAETTGLIIAHPICSTCPCENSIEILKTVRSCDILFPTILSEDGKSVFSRGGLFLVP